jgi:hypothetical protein
MTAVTPLQMQAQIKTHIIDHPTPIDMEMEAAVRKKNEEGLKPHPTGARHSALSVHHLNQVHLDWTSVPRLQITVGF